MEDHPGCEPYWQGIGAFSPVCAIQNGSRGRAGDPGKPIDDPCAKVLRYLTKEFDVIGTDGPFQDRQQIGPLGNQTNTA